MPDLHIVPARYRKIFKEAITGTVAFVNVADSECVVGYGYGTDSAACLAISPQTFMEGNWRAIDAFVAAVEMTEEPIPYLPLNIPVRTAYVGYKHWFTVYFSTMGAQLKQVADSHRWESWMTRYLALGNLCEQLMLACGQGWYVFNPNLDHAWLHHDPDATFRVWHIPNEWPTQERERRPFERSKSKFVPPRCGESYFGTVVDAVVSTLYCCSIFFFNMFFFCCCRGITDAQLQAIWAAAE